MPKTVQIRNLDDEVYAALLRQAGDEGITVPELLRREATRLAARPSVATWLTRIGRRPSTVSTAEVWQVWTSGAEIGRMLVVDAAAHQPLVST